MKKFLIPMAVLASLFLVSCQSTKSPAVGADDYAPSQSENTKVTNDLNKSKFTSDSSNNSFVNFFKGAAKYIYGDNVSIFTRNVLNQLTQNDAIMTYSIKNDAAGFGSYYTASFVYVFFEEKAREALKRAYDSYLSDFNNKRLIRKRNKSIRMYGKSQVILNWGSIKASTPNYGKGEIYFGYEFIKNSPYFTIFIPPMFNEYSRLSEQGVKSNGVEVGAANSVNRESVQLTYNFTKAQMASLLEAISEENIAEIRSYLSLSENKYFDSEADSYDSDYSDEYTEAETISSVSAPVSANTESTATEE